MQAAKKVWAKPLLIVLGRGNTEESVLVNCKNTKLHGNDTSGPSGTNCYADTQSGRQCNIATTS